MGERSAADDFDGVWFTLQALRLYHPESVDALAFTILDLNPDSPIASDLRHLSDSVPFLRYIPLHDAHNTAVRDVLFHETEIVCVLSARTLLPPGAVAALLAWFDAHPASCDPESPDGPDRRALLRWTPFPALPAASGNVGICGCWEPEPQHASLVAEHGGAGVFACRHEDWSGFSVRLHNLHGIGDEAAVLCPKIPVVSVARQAMTGVANPFGFFDAIFCPNLDRESRRWRDATLRYQTLGIAAQVERFPAILTPDNHHRGCALSWRQMIAEASRRDYTHLLVFEDDVVFLDDTLAVVGAAVAELATQEWDLCYLGAAVWA